METYATTIYVLSEEILKILGVTDSSQSSMTNAEIMTFAILSAKYFASNHKMTRYICKRLRLFKIILSNSRMNRRIHQIPLSLKRGLVAIRVFGAGFAWLKFMAPTLPKLQLLNSFRYTSQIFDIKESE